jgi:hypothetical protein
LNLPFFPTETLHTQTPIEGGDSIMFGETFVANGEAAILPRPQASPQEVLEIAIVQYVGSVFIRLVDGRMFATLGGKCLSDASGHYAVPANDAHREALKQP